ncbi:MAG TPA: hypothetical protein VGV13_10440 [Methylomirabilota bacterium]|nr:hypothetical protein [Methylomirabilota bacterium]
MALSRLGPLLLVLAYGVAFGAAAFGRTLPAFDDHPGQFYRLHHVVARGWAPWTWNPDWWAGYPEMQFYPPGFFYLGALVARGSFGLIDVAVTYQSLLWLTWLAPAVTTFLALARLLGSGWLALPGAFIALTLSAGLTSGVEGGVHVGMLPARLAWGLLPVVLMAAAPWAEDRRLPWLTVPLLAVVALTHPAHVPAAGALVVLAAWSGPGSRLHRLGAAVGGLVLAAALTAFWALPLLARLSYTRALAWGRLAPLETLTAHPLLLGLLVLAAVATRRGRSPSDTIVARFPWVMIAVVAADAALVEPLGLLWLPADRVADGAWLATVLAAGLAGGRLLERLSARTGAPVAALALAATAVAIALSLPGGTLTLWPRASQWPSYAAVERGMRLGALWAALRGAPPGRVLFVRSGVPLAYGGEWWRPHTHVTALTPLRAGRAIVHGTFTHPSPVAALVYRGEAGPGAITTLAERLDGHRLFGRPLDGLDAATFDFFAERLGIAAVVALDEDAGSLRFLDDNPALARRPPLGPFLVYERRAPTTLPIRMAPDRWTITLSGQPGEWVSTRVTYYPLWRAERGGAPLATRRGSIGDLEARLDAGVGPVELVYAAGAPEAAGVLVSALGFIAWSVGWGLRRRGD